jgi:TPR repeat protein
LTASISEFEEAETFYRVIAVALLFGNATAFAMDDVPLTDCDTYAASQEDAQRKGVGLRFDEIDAAKAIPACTTATSRFPSTARFSYQLALAYSRAGKNEDALVWYRKSAEQGYASAQYKLGFIYNRGDLGVSKDEAKAAYWYRKAAIQGHEFAEVILGSMYSEGRGVAKDETQAISWYRKAAAQGNYLAKTDLNNLEKRKETQQLAQMLKGRCTGPLSNPRIRTFGSEVLADMRSRGSWASTGLSLQGVLQDFIWKLEHEKIYEHIEGYDNQQPFFNALSMANLDTLQACFPGLADLLAEKSQRILDLDKARAEAAAEARKPVNRLLTAYKRYAYVKYCNEVRQGYAVVYVNDIELERARVTVKAVEDDGLHEDGSLDTKAMWNRAVSEIAGKYVDRGQCQMELQSLLQQNPKPSGIEKDF